jgi:hypothetical protein
MANWCNARLVVAGRRSDVLTFSRLSRARPSSLFAAGMLHGIADDMRAEWIETLEPGIAKKVYIFQIRNDDGREHFGRLSRRFPPLCFVLVYFDPNNDSNGSYFIVRGRTRNYELTQKLVDDVMARHGLTDDAFGGEWSSEDECKYWEASWELMALAEGHWQKTVLRAIRRETKRCQDRT